MATIEKQSRGESSNIVSSSGMHERMQGVEHFWKQYRGVFEATNFTKSKELKEREEWMRKTKLVDDRNEKDSIVHREEFFRSEYAQTLMRDGVPIYREFIAKLEESSPYISKKSRQRWLDRFYDEKIGFQAKKYWIKHQLPSYMASWKKIAEERVNLTKDPQFKDLITLHPKFLILRDSHKDSVLDMHCDERRSLLAEARSVLVANKKKQQSLHSQVESRLRDAAGKKILSSSKIGSWLERIFKQKHSTTSIKKFLDGQGPKSLSGLIENWSNVKERFDAVTKKAHEQGEDTAARGMHVLSEGQFLGLHYDQRVKYVEELEKRLKSAQNIGSEKKIFIEIRHAMDVHDWEEASLLIAQANVDPHLSAEDRTRLDSMERYASKFTKKTTSTDSMQQVMHAKMRTDAILAELEKSHTSLHPMILRLMKGPNANRSIHQLRWLVYNNKWCRSHGFLDDNIARKGASKQYEEITKQKTKEGKDVGRHDVMSYETADKHNIRKTEFANHKATYRHINVKDGATLSQNAEWLEREQNPKELYWTTACFHEDGDPKSENWHNDLFMMLSELRTHARTLGNAEMVYRGPHESLRKRGVSPSTSYAHAA